MSDQSIDKSAEPDSAEDITYLSETIGEQTIHGRYQTVEPEVALPDTETTGVVTVFRRGNLTDFELKPEGEPFFVGSDADESDLVFNDSRLAARQLSIIKLDGFYILSDCGTQDLATFNGVPSRQMICPVGSKCIVNMNRSTFLLNTSPKRRLETLDSSLSLRIGGQPLFSEIESTKATLTSPGCEMSLGLEPILIGSSRICNLIQPTSQPLHALVHWGKDGVYVTRLSMASILVNGLAVESSKRITRTDRIQIGGTTFNLNLAGDPELIARKMLQGQSLDFGYLCFSPHKDSVCGAFSIPVNSDAVMVGRGENADLVLNDTGISREHVQLIPSGKTCMVVDNFSSNGTFVNGMEISKIRMRAGDQLEIGRSKFHFHYD